MKAKCSPMAFTPGDVSASYSTHVMHAEERRAADWAQTETRTRDNDTDIVTACTSEAS
jgi:hypothetical protein